MLTKSAFQKFVDCKNEFWLDHHFPEPKGEITITHQFRREMGYEVERLARELPIFQPREGYRIEFGREFQTATLYAKADVVITDLSTGEIEIYEVKSGTSAKESYKNDLAFQFLVATRAGFTVKKACLVYLNNTYLFDGEHIEVSDLFCISDETEAAALIQDTMAAEADNALAFRDLPEPVVTLLDYCKGSKLECRSVTRRFPDIPEYNVSHLFNAGSKKLNALLESGVLNLCDIPADFKLTDREAQMVEVERSGSCYIERDKILEEINALRYPLNFLDYESFSPAIPRFASTRSYQQVVFQYSLHTIDAPGAELRHSYHLSRNDGRHPSAEIAERLRQDLDGRVGTIIIWSEGFEKARNSEMGQMFPEHAEFFAELNEAVYDLRKVFSKRLYIDPAFRGRDSIKKVLPVLCPDLSYDQMDISDGQTAAIKWYHLATQRGTPEDQQKIYQDLCTYCHLDTLAMVRIYELLRQV